MPESSINERSILSCGSFDLPKNASSSLTSSAELIWGLVHDTAVHQTHCGHDLYVKWLNVILNEANQRWVVKLRCFAALSQPPLSVPTFVQFVEFTYRKKWYCNKQNYGYRQRSWLSLILHCLYNYCLYLPPALEHQVLEIVPINTPCSIPEIKTFSKKSCLLHW